MGIISTITAFGDLDLTTSDYEAFLDASDNTQLGPSVSTKPLKRGLSAPMHGALIREADTITVTVVVKGNDAALAAFLIAFDITNDALRKLKGTDGVSADLWGLMGRPIKPPTLRGGVYKIVLEVPDKLWTKETAITHTEAVTSSGHTWDIAIGGSAKAQPIFEITPVHAKGAGGFDYREYLAICNPGDKNFVESPFLFKTLNTAALVAAGKMLASGDDLLLMCDGHIVSRWLFGMNSAATLIQGNISLLPRKEMTLSGAMAGSGAVATITVKTTPANKAALIAMAAAAVTGKVLIKTGANVEIFTYTGVNAATYKLTGVKRAQRNTSMALHSDGDIVKFLEHDYYLLYGCPAAGVPLDDGRQPLIDGATSSNTSWVQNIFATDDGLQTGGWTGKRISTLGGRYAVSDIYTGTLGADADPATEMGNLIGAYQVANAWKADTAETQWTIFVPGGITNTQFTLQKERTSAFWPAAAKLEKSVNGKTWIQVWNETTPASLSTPATVTHTNAMGATYYYLRVTFKGQVGAGANNAAYFEIQTVTLTLDAAGVPAVIFDSGELANYQLDGTLTNVTTEDAITLRGTMKLLDVLTVDCAAREIYTDDGKPAFEFLDWNTSREAWMDCKPNAVNTFKYEEANVDEVDVAATIYERSVA